MLLYFLSVCSVLLIGFHVFSPLLFHLFTTVSDCLLVLVWLLCLTSFWEHLDFACSPPAHLMSFLPKSSVALRFEISVLHILFLSLLVKLRSARLSSHCLSCAACSDYLCTDRWGWLSIWAADPIQVLYLTKSPKATYLLGSSQSSFGELPITVLSIAANGHSCSNGKKTRTFIPLLTPVFNL